MLLQKRKQSCFPWLWVTIVGQYNTAEVLTKGLQLVLRTTLNVDCGHWRFWNRDIWMLSQTQTNCLDCLELTSCVYLHHESSELCTLYMQLPNLAIFKFNLRWNLRSPKRLVLDHFYYRKRPCISRTFFHKIEAINQGCGLSMGTSVFGVLKNLINIHTTS